MRSNDAMAHDVFFDRGPFPVGVRTKECRDPSRNDRLLAMEIWYPADDAHAGRDLADSTRDVYRIFPGFPTSAQDAVRDAVPRQGSYPLVVFSHGWIGHRRQSTFLCTHLASHGFVVAGVDHPGSTLKDRIGGGRGAERSRDRAASERRVEARPADVSFTVDALLHGAVGDAAPLVDAPPVGVVGHSYGGWTALAASGRDARVGAVVALAPAGGSSPFGNGGLLTDALCPDWGRAVPTLVIAADGDSVLPLAGMSDLLACIPLPKTIVVLKDTDHFHFLDRGGLVHEFMRGGTFPPFDRIAATMRPVAELSSEGAVHAAVAGLAQAHLAAALRNDAAAARFLAGDIREALAARGVGAVLP